MHSYEYMIKEGQPCIDLDLVPAVSYSFVFLLEVECRNLVAEVTEATTTLLRLGLINKN